MKNFDLIVVGGGIVGLAHALEGAKRGLHVCVVERDTKCVGASIRNFGFITVTGQAEGETFRRAQVSREVWNEISADIGVGIVHRGLWMVAHRPEAWAVLDEFMQSPMAGGCELLSVADAKKRAPCLKLENSAGALYSPHELRVESRDAIPKLAAWLQSRWNVHFRYGETVVGINTPQVHTSRDILYADRVVFCPGTMLNGPFANRIAQHQLLLCRLQMLRIMPAQKFTLPGAVMMDLSLVRYEGYSKRPSAASLLARLMDEEQQSLADGIHLIVVQSDDGSLVVGDSHHYDPTPDPFALAHVEAAILRHLDDTIEIGPYHVVERWVGEYPSSPDHIAVIDAPDNATRIVMVTSGTGASTAFGLAQDVFSTW